MKEFWNFIQMVFMAVGGWLGWFMGGCDGLLYALIAFVVIDYLTGVMCAFADHTLSSEVGFRGICRKVLIFLLVGLANILDVAVIGNGSVLRTAVIFFYISNEGVSLLENAGHPSLHHFCHAAVPAHPSSSAGSAAPDALHSPTGSRPHWKYRKR